MTGTSGKTKRRYWHGRRGEGEAIKWLHAHVDHVGDDCLIWPFSKTCNGHGLVGYLGKVLKAHRVMCELVNGPPPTPTHEAAHSCGRGHDACVHPKHLSWKTRGDNQRDRRLHGTKSTGGRGKITYEDAVRIRSLAGTASDNEIGQLFGITASTVRGIIAGRHWTKRTVRNTHPDALTAGK